MTQSKQEQKLVRELHDQVLSVLREKEREVDEQLSDIAQVHQQVSQLNDQDTLEDYRRARIEQLKSLHSKRLQYLNEGYGKLLDVDSESQFFDACRNTHYVLAHFYRPTTLRCQYLDQMMHETSQKYFNTKFLRVNAEKVPFLCERFNIWCIPTLMIIIDGKTDHSVIGFTEFGGDGFTLDDFTKVLTKRGILPPEKSLLEARGPA